ncbi:MAG: polysaccharide deacetylase family protein [Firmicutes bacterium]|nr:polysaccharide deacetylase family protein [Bacillota bacterium]
MKAFGRSFPKVSSSVVLGLALMVAGSGIMRSQMLELAVSGAAGTSDRLLPIYSVEQSEKKISISFDAAWGDEHTKAILDTLDQYGVKTTFFLVDFWAEKYPEDVKEIAARGHELGNHSATHPDMAKLSKEQMATELNKTADTIEGICGVRPTLFRPPFGSYNNAVIETCESLGYKVIQWSVDSLDWKEISAEQIVERVTRNVEPGSIVLFHNNAEYVETYLPKILQILTDQGYEIVPVGELIYRDQYKMDHTGKQIPMS